jgi:hypothetical protein
MGVEMPRMGWIQIPEVAASMTRGFEADSGDGLKGLGNGPQAAASNTTSAKPPSLPWLKSSRILRTFRHITAQATISPRIRATTRKKI